MSTGTRPKLARSSGAFGQTAPLTTTLRGETCLGSDFH